MAWIRAPVFVLMQLDHRQEIFERIDERIENGIVLRRVAAGDELAVSGLLGRCDDAAAIAPREQNCAEPDEARDPPERAQRHVAEPDRVLQHQAPRALQNALMAEA